MRKALSVLMAGLMLMSACAPAARAGDMEVLVKKLVEKGILSPNEAQLMLGEAKQETAIEMAKGEATTAPGWTQMIKISGDGRYRTQMDWGKLNRPQPYRARQRYRARVGIEAKINDQLSGMVRIASGNDNKANSTNQTFDANFSKKPVWLDLYYMVWTPKISPEIGEAKVYGGKMPNPFQYTEIMWDPDINPEGGAVQFTSPTFFEDSVPTYFYSNSGGFWLGESAAWGADPMLWVSQAGFNSMVYSEWETTLDTSVAYYSFSNIENKTIDFRPWTNNGWKFQDVELLLQLDSKRFMSWEMPWGLYTDLITNPDSDYQKAYNLGGYLGKKKPKDVNDWKGWVEFRWLDPDSVLDTMPDSDFFGYNNRGQAKEGGTNTRGINTGFQYMIFKNTLLNLEYYYTTPINVSDGVVGAMVEPYQLLQMDVNIKF